MLDGFHLLFKEHLQQKHLFISWNRAEKPANVWRSSTRRLEVVDNLEIFWTNDETIIEFGFRIMWRIILISEAVINLCRFAQFYTPYILSLI